MVNNHGYVLHKVAQKKWRRHDYNRYQKYYPVTPNDILNVFDMWYLSIEKDFPEKLSFISYKKQRNHGPS